MKNKLETNRLVMSQLRTSEYELSQSASSDKNRTLQQ
jgi:hypothetical protein